MMELSLEDDRRGQGEAADDKLVTYGRLQSETIEIGLPDKCHSFVVDSDVAVGPEGCVTSRGTGTRLVSTSSSVGESN